MSVSFFEGSLRDRGKLLGIAFGSRRGGGAIAARCGRDPRGDLHQVGGFLKAWAWPWRRFSIYAPDCSFHAGAFATMEICGNGCGRAPRTRCTSRTGPAVFLLWAKEGKPYLARTALLRRRLRRLLKEPARASRMLNLHGVVERIEYWRTGSQLESALTLYRTGTASYFPGDDWRRMVRLRPPAFVRVTTGQSVPTNRMVATQAGARAVLRPVRDARGGRKLQQRGARSVSSPAMRRKPAAVPAASGLHLWRDEPAACGGSAQSGGKPRRE